MIETRLSQEGVKSLYLDGDTPADERVKLCDTFNSGHGSVFLLSLKAGGTGLNLTGADMVIHYDPWWNPAAEEQLSTARTASARPRRSRSCACWCTIPSRSRWSA